MHLEGITTQNPKLVLDTASGIAIRFTKYKAKIPHTCNGAIVVIAWGPRQLNAFVKLIGQL